MKIIKNLLFCVVVLSIVFSFSGLAEANTTWRLGGVHAVETPETKGLEYFAELVEEKTEGELIIEVYPAGQLGEAVTMIEGTITGAQQIFANVMDWNQHVVDDFAILAMPFAFDDFDHIRAFLETERFKEMEAGLEEEGLILLASNWYRMPRVLVTKFPVFSLEDIQGKTLRMPALETYFETWSDLGANTIEIPWAEAYDAIGRGMSDGMDSPVASIRGMGFYRVAPYITNTRHQIAPFNLLVNKDAFLNLDEDIRIAVKEAAEEAGDYYTKMIVEEFEADKRQMLSEGAVYIEIDTSEFADKAMETAEKFEQRGDWSEGLYDEVRSLVE